jgi:uncharacterized DUF497 family protein
MQFEWDPDKAAKNLKLHKVDFEVAQRVFEDPFHIDDIDDRRRLRRGTVEHHRHGRQSASGRDLHPEGWRYQSHLRTKSEAI